MLSLTKKSEYALIAICHLANHPDEVVSARDIAEQHAVPLPLLMNVLKLLNQAGLISSVRGARGGYRLATDPADVSLSQMVEAIEGPVRFVPCAPGEHHDGRPCDRMHLCTIRKPLHRVHDAFQEFLAGVSVAQIAAPDARLKVATADDAAPKAVAQ